MTERDLIQRLADALQERCKYEGPFSEDGELCCIASAYLAQAPAEPVAHVTLHQTGLEFGSFDNYCIHAECDLVVGQPLYANPPAQPAPSAPNGWKEAAIAWEVCASIHREYAKRKDGLYTTRQSDFVKHANNARAMIHEILRDES
jgi:hypothetical protein